MWSKGVKDALLVPLVAIVVFSLCDFNLSVARDVEEVRVMLSKVLPETPGGFSGVASANREITLSWNAAQHAAGYYIYYSTIPGFSESEGERLAAVFGTSVAHGNLKEDQNYYYAVSAFNENGESKLSERVGVLAQLVIGTTSIVDIEQSNPGEITLSWLILPDTDSYTVYYTTAPGVTKDNSTMISQAGNTLTLSGLENNTTYYFRVSASVQKEGGALAEGPLSPELSLTSYSSPAMPLIDPPAYGASGGELLISWEPALNAVTYRLYWGSTPGIDITNEYFETTSVNFTHTGLSHMVTYYYRVVAISGPYHSSLSAEVSKTAYGDLSAVSFVSVVQTATDELTISWAPVENATAYHLYWGYAPGVWTGSDVVSFITGNQYVHQGVAGGDTLYYRVAAVNPATESPLSIEVSGQVQTSLGFSEIIDVVASAGGELTISWSPDPNATYYELFWNTSGGVSESDSMITVNGLSYVHTGLTPGTTYHYAVRGRDTLYSSPLSVEKSGITFGALGMPATIAATRSNPGELSISWGAVTGASSYKLYWSSGTDPVDSSSSFIVVSGATSLIHTGLVDAVQYNYRVSAYNEQCETSYCAPGMKEGPLSLASASEVVYDTPGVPVITSVVTSAGKELTIHWDGVDGAVGYELFYSEGAPDSWVYLGDTGETSYVHTGLKNDIEYFYQLRAYSGPATGVAAYYSDYSAAASGVSYCVPGAPVIVVIIPGNGMYTVIWENDMSCGATGSVVYSSSEQMPTRSGDGEVVSMSSHVVPEGSGQYFRVLSYNGAFISPLSEEVYLASTDASMDEPEAVFAETFENGLASWHDTGGAYQVKGLSAQVYASLAHSLELRSVVENQPAEGVAYFFQTGRFSYLSWRARCGVENSTGHLLVSDTLGREIFHFLCGGYFYENLNAGSPAVPLEPEEWFFVELRDVDWNRRRYNYYINGNLITTGASFADTQAREAARMSLYNLLPGTSYFDDIEIR